MKVIHLISISRHVIVDALNYKEPLCDLVTTILYLNWMNEVLTGY